MIIITLLFYIVFLESHYYHVFLSLPLVIIFIFLTISFTVSIIVGIYQCCYDRYSICPYFDSDTRTHANTQTVSPLALFWLSLFLHLSIAADILLLSYTPLVMVYESAGPDDPQGCGSVISKEFMQTQGGPLLVITPHIRCETTPVNHLFCRPFFLGPQKSHNNSI